MKRSEVNKQMPPSIHGPVQGEENLVELHRGHQASVTAPSFEELFLDLYDRLYRALHFVSGSSHDADEPNRLSRERRVPARRKRQPWSGSSVEMAASRKSGAGPHAEVGWVVTRRFRPERRSNETGL
jgi:hypothetical protein